ncbi:MAG: divergent polysaccharide deacetylase family protein [Gammaproteobacteria bacterium]|nr:divergent polysaccharide deacetylase family protein [Gammaproteobacteria bacterium]MDH3428837.1 divergent polysaccharide deacetylase family protein [Gammaproteobacteria bacterium]MDH3433479.1 divergent polysaccharide deacetylase family protein [Gammaproteobacteria bacterium]
MIRSGFLCVAAVTLLVAQSVAEPKPRIAIIIDDLGYELEAGRRAIDLPGPVAFAVLPGTPQGRQLARLANERGKEVLMHLPLESVENRDFLEPGALMLDMSRRTFAETFAGAIATVPFAIGVSSHRGSLLTRHPGHMGWLMEEILARENLFFIDSYTTHESVALRIAAESGVTATRRDVFLDHDRSSKAVSREFERLKAVARQRGSAVAIGHPFRETLEVLERELPKLHAEGFELVAISELLSRPLNRI